MYQQNYLFFKIKKIIIVLSTDQLNAGQMDLLHHISQEQIEIKLVLNRILSKLENLEGNSKQNTSIYLETDFLNHFPINNEDELNKVNDFILNELGFVDKLVCKNKK